MFYKLYLYYKINKNINVFIMPVVFLFVNITVLLTAKQLEDTNFGVAFFIFGLIMFASVFTRILTTEFSAGYWEIMSSYPEKKIYIFLFKYLLALLFCLIPMISCFMLSFVIRGGNYKGEHSLFLFAVSTFIDCLFIGNVTSFISLLIRNYELSLIASLIVVLILLRINISILLSMTLFSLLALLFLILSIKIYTQGDKIINEN